MPPGEFEQILAVLAELRAEVAELKTEVASIESRLTALEEKLASNQSPWLRGDLEAARWAGFKSAKSFRTWARRNSVRPSKDDEGMNFWSRADIFTAREKGKA